MEELSFIDQAQEASEVKTKKWFESRMFWMNLIITLIGIVTLFEDALNRNPQLTISGIMLLIVGALNIILRIWFTDTPIAH